MPGVVVTCPMQISIWERETFFAERDVIIIGAGLCGLWCAHDIKTKFPGYKILVVEKGAIPAGASTRNAGFACFGSPTELLHDAESMGASRMWEIAEMRYIGIRKIQEQLGTAAIGYDHCGGFECLRQDKNDLSKLQDQLPWLNVGLKEITGEKETFVWANDKLHAFGLHNFDALVENKREGALHSGKLLQALTQKVRSLGVEIFNGMEIAHYDERGGKAVLTSAEGHRLGARQVVVCCNAFTSLFPGAPTVIPARGQIMVTAPIEGMKLHGTFHFDEGFYYFRNVGNRLLLGGARNCSVAAETTQEFNTTAVIQDELERFVQKHILPGRDYAVEYRWSGIMGFTEDKQPMVKQISELVTVVVACNGMGVALSPMISQRLPLYHSP